MKKFIVFAALVAVVLGAALSASASDPIDSSKMPGGSKVICRNEDGSIHEILFFDATGDHFYVQRPPYGLPVWFTWNSFWKCYIAYPSDILEDGYFFWFLPDGRTWWKHHKDPFYYKGNVDWM